MSLRYRMLKFYLGKDAADRGEGEKKGASEGGMECCLDGGRSCK